LSRLISAIDDLWTITFNNTKDVVIKKKQLHSLITRNYPDNLSDQNKAGQLLPNPLIRMKIDFKKYPVNHPVNTLRNRQMTLIYDVNKPIIVDGKLTDYEFMTTPNGEPLTIDNIHTVITRSTYIEKISLDLSSVSSSTFASLPIKINKIWLSIVESKFENLDEIIINPNSIVVENDNEDDLLDE